MRREPAKRGATDQGLGRSRGGWGSKLHLLTDRAGQPVALDVTAGQRHESTVAIELLEAGLERLWFDALAGDRGYSTHNVRD